MSLPHFGQSNPVYLCSSFSKLLSSPDHKRNTEGRIVNSCHLSGYVLSFLYTAFKKIWFQSNVTRIVQRIHSSSIFPPYTNIYHIYYTLFLLPIPKQEHKNILLYKHSTIMKLRKLPPMQYFVSNLLTLSLFCLLS